MKYHLKRMDIISELVLPGATYGNVFPYTSGENSDIDLAVDEYGQLIMQIECSTRDTIEYGDGTLDAKIDILLKYCILIGSN